MSGAAGPAAPPASSAPRASGFPRRSAASVDTQDLHATLGRILARAKARDPRVLLEPEGMRLLEAMGFAVPRRVEVLAGGASRIPRRFEPALPGERVVVKVVSPDVLHKTEARGVAVVPNRREDIFAEIRSMERRFSGARILSYLICEYVRHEPGLGREYLLGARWTREFGPVVTLGPGGLHAEFMARALPAESGLVIASPRLGRAEALRDSIERSLPHRLATEPQRGRRPELDLEQLVCDIRRMLDVVGAFCPDPLAELEVNPLVVSGSELVALDALGTFTAETPAPPAARPLEKIDRLLEPHSIAVMGVSEKMNPGRRILQNVLAAGFDRGRVTVVKPGASEIDGCRCVASLADLPVPVDLVVVALAAEPAAEAVIEIARHDRAESVILIASGLEEKAGGAPLVSRVRAALAEARAEGRGPVVNGGNCLGIRSAPGRYDTLFLPPHKLPERRTQADPLALVTGSGAFAVAQLTKLPGIDPRYVVTIGNQTDLTAGDYLHWLADDEELEVVGLYLEGFAPLDGARVLEAIERLTERGRTVVLHLAGRTRAGAQAAASHTAAVAGDHLVARALTSAAGAIVTDTLEDFADLLRLFVRLRGRRAEGARIAAVSNAGFECVAMADALGPFELARFAPATQRALRAVLEEARLADIVAVRNPMDVTPILGDAQYEQVARAVLADSGVDAAVIGCVPCTGALETLDAAERGEDVGREGSIASRLVRVWAESEKPWVAVVDAGRLYDPMVRVLEEGRVPTFRTADRALRLFGAWMRTTHAGVARVG